LHQLSHEMLSYRPGRSVGAPLRRTGFRRVLPSRSYSSLYESSASVALSPESFGEVEARTPIGGTVATVFGCTGFLGRYVVNMLGRLGVQVVIPYRAEEKAYDHLKVMGDVGQIVPFFFSVRDKASIKTAVSHSNIVINLIGRHYETRNFSFYDVNVEAAGLIAAACKEAGVERLIHVSCVGADLQSDSGFARSKAAGENLVKDIFPSATILRCTHLIGPEDRWLNKFGYMCKFLQPYILLLVDKTVKVQPLYVGDVSTAVHQVLRHTNTAGKTYELGGPQTFTLEQFIHDVIFNYVKVSNGKIISVQPDIARFLAGLFEMNRNPIWTKDELDFMLEDIVVPNAPDTLTLAHLNIQPTHAAEFAPNILRLYRRPTRYDAA